MITIKLAESPYDYDRARDLIEEYADWLGFDLSYDDFERELADLASIYGPPQGGLLLLFDDDRAVGCAAVRPFEGDHAELKRMFVQPSYQGLGYGRRIAEKAIALARSLGFKRLLLDTLPHMAGAMALYESLGFCEIPAYRYNPDPDAVYMALRL